MTVAYPLPIVAEAATTVARESGSLDFTGRGSSEEVPRISAPTSDAFRNGARSGARPLRAEHSRSTDVPRAYLREVGRVNLLTAAEERDLGRRIEEAGSRLGRALLSLPLIALDVLASAERLRAGVSKNGRAGVAFGALRHLMAERCRIEKALRRARSRVKRERLRRYLRQNHREIRRKLSKLILSPGLCECLAEKARAYGQRVAKIEQLMAQSRKRGRSRWRT